MEIIKKGAVILLAMSFVCPISGSAQNQNTANKISNTANEVSNTANEIGNTANEIGNTAKTIVGLFKRKKNNTEGSNATDAALSGESSFAEEAFRIVTNHPDFKIKVLRCEASGSTCVIDMIFENIGSQDVQIGLYGGNWTGANGKSSAYDDEMNKYDGRNILVAIANKELTDAYHTIDLPAGIPLKAHIQIEGVKTSVRMFRRIDLNVMCEQWNIGREKMVKLFNVPISREGDE